MLNADDSLAILNLFGAYISSKRDQAGHIIMIVWYCVIISPPKALVSIACLDGYSLMLVLQLQDNLTLGQQDVQGDAQVDIRVNFQGKCGYVDDICHYQFLPLSQLQEVIFHIVI